MRRAFWSTGLLLSLVFLPVSSAELDLETLTWMSGSWGSSTEQSSAEEIWTAPRGGLMLGLHRDIFDNGSSFFEYLRIETRDDGIYYVASPRGQGSTSFKWIESADRRAVFANDEHDWPQRITYWIDEAGRLSARAEGKPGSGARAAEWRWSPVAP